MTIREAEDASGVNKDTISRIERGTRTPHALTVARLARVYGRTTEELLGKAEAPSRSGRPTEESAEQPRDYPWPWMAGALADLLMQMYSMGRGGTKDSYMLFRLALMVSDVVNTPVGEISETERAERDRVSSQLMTIADDALEVYKAEGAELPSVEALRAEKQQNAQKAARRLKESAS